MKYPNALRDIEAAPLSELFIIFALISLALFPLVLYMNRTAADSGFIFAFVCLFAGVVLKMARVCGWFSCFNFHFFFRYSKLVIFTVISIVFLYLGYLWLGITGVIIFLTVLIIVTILCGRCNKKIFASSEDLEKHSFGRKDLYFIGILLMLNLLSIRKLLTGEPVVYYDWPGFGKGVLDSFPTLLTNQYVFFASPLLLLIGNELTSNVFLLAWIPITSVTFYFFAVKMLRNREAAFVASFIYVFNPAVLDRFLSAHLGILIGYAMMPLILLFFVKSLQSQNYNTSIIFSLMTGALFAISGSLASHFFYLNALLLSLFFILFSVLNDPYKNLMKGTSFLIIVFLTGAMLAIPWLSSPVKLVTSGYFSSLATLSYTESLSTQTHLYNNFRLIGQSGGPFIENIGYTSMSIWPLLGFITVILGFSALLLRRDRMEKLVLIFSLITLVGIILSTGTMYMGGLYRWLFLNFPFFFAFREPSKFLVIAGFGLSMLAGITTDAILSMKRNNSAKFLGAIFLSLVLLSQTIFAWPMFTGDNLLYSQHPRYIMTKEYRELGAWVDSQDDAYKVVVLPYTGFTFHTWHLVSKKPIVLIDISSLSPLNSDIFQYSIFMFETLGRGDTFGFSVLASIEGVKYVVIQKDMDLKNVQETPDDYGYIPPFNRFDLSGPMLSKLLETSPEFKKIQEFGPYTVFENQKFIKQTGKEKPVLAAGDRNLILEMAKRPDFNFKQNELIFVNKLTPDRLAELINNTDLISNTYGNETTFALLNDVYKINVYDYAFPAGLGDDPRNIIYKKWIRSDIFEFLEGEVFGRGAITYGKGYAITRGDAELKIPYSLAQDGHYQVWVRILYAPNRGNLSVLLDDKRVAEIFPDSPDFKGFWWVKIAEVDIIKQIHNVEIINSNGENVIDQIAFFPAEGKSYAPQNR